MATLIPDSPKDCTYGERLVFEKLGRDLDNDWIVLHSLGLPGHPKKLWGEADIVVLSTRGIFALEVKGGKVSCQDGVWTFGEPNGKSYTKKEDPWTQAKETMFAIMETLCAADKTFKNVLFGYGVVMPMETFTATGAEIEQGVLLDRREFKANLGYYIARLNRFWNDQYQKKHGRTPGLPTRADIRRAREVLRPNVESAYSLGSYLNGVESQLIQLSRDQVRASRRMAANPRTIVSGKAGTGKTIIALERAAQLTSQGLRVAYLCYNKLLARHVSKSLSADARAAGVEVHHVHALYRDVIQSAGMLARLSAAEGDHELYSRIFPEVFTEAFIETNSEPYDALVVDEAQDLLTPENLEALDVMLRYGLNRGKWHIFFDPLQNIYNSTIQEQVRERLSEAQPAMDELFENCRNTRQVAVQASIISGIDLALEGAPDGVECENVYYSDEAAFHKLFEKEIRALLQQQVKPTDIAILSMRKRENSLIHNLAIVAGIPIVEAEDPEENGILFSTMHAFKGLERLVVLAIDMEGIGHPACRMLHYAGLSRARAVLKTFIHQDQKQAYMDQAVAYGSRSLGAPH
ncbi:MAG TPA: NERD domain-containing protein [Burkholderiaceae bacterium]|nr:NERD domain-containing protein [Burkholderiaceae bacterium]